MLQNVTTTEVHRSVSAEPQHFCNSSKSTISAGLLRDYVRVSEICASTISTDAPLLFSGRSKVDNDFCCPTEIYREVDFMAPQGQIFHLPSVGPLIFVTNKSDHSGIICRFDDVVVILGNTVVCKQAVL